MANVSTYIRTNEQTFALGFLLHHHSEVLN